MAAAPLGGACCALLTAVATVLVFAVLAVLFGITLADEVRYAETSMGLGVPRWWFTAAIPLLCAAIALRAAWAGWRAWRDPPARSASAELEERL